MEKYSKEFSEEIIQQKFGIWKHLREKKKRKNRDIKIVSVSAASQLYFMEKNNEKALKKTHLKTPKPERFKYLLVERNEQWRC